MEDAPGANELHRPEVVELPAGAVDPPDAEELVEQTASGAVPQVGHVAFRVARRRPNRGSGAQAQIPKGEVAHAGVRFDGELTVTDPGELRDAVAAGIGPAKAFGFGLLSLARPR